MPATGPQAITPRRSDQELPGQTLDQLRLRGIGSRHGPQDFRLLTWKQTRRRYYGADRIREDKLVLYNPAKMRVERYRYRGTQIATPFNIDVVDPAGARFRRTGHDDVEFVGQVSELIS